MTENKQMNILYCCDTNYAMPMTVSITSVFENNKNNLIIVYVFYSYLSEDQKKKLDKIAQQYKQTISLVKINERYFDDAPTARWTKEAYYRLLVSELLPSNSDKVLYLDCDTIVNKSLDALFNFDLKGKYIAALKTEFEYKNFGHRLGLPEFSDYYQTGVLLFDYQKIKYILSYENIIKIIKALGENLEIVDQDIINVMFNNKIVSLPIIYNNDEITNYYRYNKFKIFNQIDIKSIQDTVIFHYASGKPWNNLFSGSCEDIWYKYLLLSPYAELYNKKFNKLRYHILRINLFKIIFYLYISITPSINRFFKNIFPEDLYIKLKKVYRKHIK